MAQAKAQNQIEGVDDFGNGTGPRDQRGKWPGDGPTTGPGKMGEETAWVQQ